MKARNARQRLARTMRYVCCTLCALFVLSAHPASAWAIENSSPASDGNVFYISYQRFNADFVTTSPGACTAVSQRPGTC